MEKDCTLSIESLIERFCTRWTLKTLFTLEEAGDGAMRFGEIRKRSGCTSDKMLNNALKELDADGLIRKKFYPENPNRPDYSLTERGRSLLTVLHHLRDWATDNMQDIMADRKERDEMREKYDK
jgi:DNA-binding HxlR family transcriptional regulator